ncbi:MAG: 1-acyl-sn-glycerol-3-phosphate acyltransferase [Planctomycetales bacterium]|nr:1-acyl-sn-glycerol-3-phosphate acyltransferase [Planctomycetales bacterium]
MQNIVIEEPYKFVPPSYSRLWPRLIQLYLPRHLRKAFGVHSIETRGAENLRATLAAGHGAILAPNHCRLSDPLCFTDLSKQTGRYPHAMASWHLFKQSPLNHFMLRRVGAFSVYREGVDRQAIETAVEILVEGSRPLILFAEGAISRHNDVLMPLMDGVSFIARTAAKRREKAGLSGGVMVHPVAIRYFFRGDLEASIVPVLEEIESHFSWHPQYDKTLIERIRQIGQALLSLKEIEYFGWARTGDFYARVDNLISDVLEKIEEFWGIRDKEEGVVARVKAIRSAILPQLIQGDLSEAEKHERRKQLAACYYVQQMSHYPRNYVRMSAPNVAEHLLETVERFEEDFTDRLRVHAPLHVVVQVGEAIEAPLKRDRSQSSDPVMDALRIQLNAMLHELAREAQTI